ncbi:MAG TPA: divergent polysaccharide deacetylase family protein, partial [Thermoanaerobaculia bacterium]|nr:divergent polysaccharide deacetylase family protein [Thermoanaerobaculia bacterium]
MTRRSPRGKKRSGGRFRSALLLVLAVALGAAATWAMRGCPGTGRRPSPAPAPGAPAPSSATPRARAPRSSRMPPDFESVNGGAGGGVVAVVLDDLGYDERALETLSGWEGPLALAVIPSAPYAGRADALAKSKGWDLLVHLPREPEAGRSEAESIGGRDDDAAIRARVL